MWKQTAGVALTTLVVATGCSVGTTEAAPAPSGQSTAQQGNGPGDGAGPGAGQESPGGTNQSPGGPGNGGPGNGTGMQVPTVGMLTATEAELLSFGREEERMAHDLYVVFDERYDLQVFSNISASETHHFDLLGDALSQAGLPDPSAVSTAGVFADPTIQALYDDWYDQGQASAKAAVQASIELEKRDIADLEQAIAQTQDAGLKQVFQNLRSASEKHLDAFEKVLGTL